MNIQKIFSQYISERIPKKATNILFQLFNGVEAVLNAMDYKLNIVKRERNILTAQNITSLRHLASQNGFEPELNLPAKGMVKLSFDAKFFSRVGRSLYLPPYSVFKNKYNGLEYYYNNNRSLQLKDNDVVIPLVEGSIKTKQQTINEASEITRIYLPEENVTFASIIVSVSGVHFKEVKSLSDSYGDNNGKIYVVKFSSDIQKPIVLYIMGLNKKDVVDISYRVSYGEDGNLKERTFFETFDIIDSQGLSIQVDDDEALMYNISGFTDGSNGTDENALRAAQGYNHGNILLYDNISYRNYLAMHSSVMIQDIKVSDNHKSINNIYLSNKCQLNDTGIGADVKKQYKEIIEQSLYIIPEEKQDVISAGIEENEFCMSSHNIYHSLTQKYAIQITFLNMMEAQRYGISREDHQDRLDRLIYLEFSKFFYDRFHMINLEQLFSDYMNKNNIRFEFTLFRESLDSDKEIKFADSYIIKHAEYMPILCGDFYITAKTQLFFDINYVEHKETK